MARIVMARIEHVQVGERVIVGADNPVPVEIFDIFILDGIAKGCALAFCTRVKLPRVNILACSRIIPGTHVSHPRWQRIAIFVWPIPPHPVSAQAAVLTIITFPRVVCNVTYVKLRACLHLVPEGENMLPAHQEQRGEEQGRHLHHDRGICPRRTIRRAQFEGAAPKPRRTAATTPVGTKCGCRSVNRARRGGAADEVQQLLGGRAIKLLGWAVRLSMWAVELGRRSVVSSAGPSSCAIDLGCQVLAANLGRRTRPSSGDVQCWAIELIWRLSSLAVDLGRRCGAASGICTGRAPPIGRRTGAANWVIQVGPSS